MGHSAGGAFIQVVLDHGYGCAGVALNSAPTEGVRRTPWTQLHSVFPVLKNPLNHHRAVGFDLEQWTLRLHQHVHRGGVAGVLRALPHPRLGHGSCSTRSSPTSSPATRTPGSTSRTPNRAPLLFLSGSEDHIMPPSVQASNAKHYKGDGTITEHDTYDGRPHLMVAGAGWEEIADRRPRLGPRTRRVDARRRRRSTPDRCPRSPSPTSAGRPR